ncbi:PREDICTED: vitamin K-dependent protein C-like [Branchiostoma belcheri]|uniref:Vitamin K-dependent protein C-like n=1 Tax=Branchiostoma belcheri TaxID=7741 RepID=A0A6P4YH85_BRABE|nr:PREDICTED: vitamin K-dependent protein C-like [Branchiostoma belcheri]
MPVRSDGECLREIRDNSKSGQALSYTDRMFCAGHRSRDRGGPRDACRGDSGGPFVVKHVKKEDRPYHACLTERSLPGTSKTAHVQYVPVRKAYIHGDYDRFSDVFDYDIALLELRDAAVLGPWVRPVCLPANVRQGLRMSEEGTTGTVVGWGRLGDGATPTAQILQQISLPVQPHGTCERAMEAAGRPTAQYTSRMFCAGDVAGGRDACPGDSGGPFMVSRKSGGTDRWHLVGVVSTGTDQGCGRPGQLGLYTMVAKYLDWIHSIIN